MSDTLTREKIGLAVRRMLVAESRISADPATLADDEPLKGSVLNVNSLGFVGVLVRLEDELGVDLPDNLFLDRTFTTVGDIVAIVADETASS